MKHIGIMQNNNTIQISHLDYLAWIELKPNHEIRYCYDMGECSFNFGLFSEIGQPFVKVFAYMLAECGVELGKIDSESKYCDSWISYRYNGKTHKEIK